MHPNAREVAMFARECQLRKTVDQGRAMPEYLQYAATLLDLQPQERETRLREQTLSLETAMNRITETEKTPSDLFEKVVSI